ncbi:MAG: hypothetical protein GWM98_20470 [Nitrospinaceae bacterium]|nr:hypothetical protein [Nitrospinaceae bacterium]NIR56409.1 hypothetical protein [Nitrospinaceae bacterium]NIS86873.1 hypothetical protein [Nitrospinaceae bacterium]NIT83709.1 hypothetical protein [Nitrospinaceae bacterium]NIU45910.1 hypothetical protein [Nitrospinaceae bacterium]
MKPVQYILPLLLVLSLFPGGSMAETQSVAWITAEEAALPDRKPEKLQFRGSATREPINGHMEIGPEIKVVKPETTENPLKKVDIDILFEKNPMGEEIDMKSLRVTYLKLFDIDITERVLPYVHGRRIQARQIDFPSGKHEIEIKIRDVDQVESRRTLSIMVQ